jgi:hypothetical protein
LAFKPIPNLDLNIPTEFYSLEVRGEAVKAFLSFSNPLTQATSWNEVSMTIAHVAMYRAGLQGLAAIVDPKKPAMISTEHLGPNNIRSDLTFQWVGESFALEMKRPESGHATLWKGWPWSPESTTISEGTQSILSQACHLTLVTCIRANLFYQIWRYVTANIGDMMGGVAVPPTRLHVVACNSSERTMAVSSNFIEGESLVVPYFPWIELFQGKMTIVRRFHFPRFPSLTISSWQDPNKRKSMGKFLRARALDHVCLDGESWRPRVVEGGGTPGRWEKVR